MNLDRNRVNGSIHEEIAWFYQSLIDIFKNLPDDDQDTEEGDNSMQEIEELTTKRDDILKTDCPIVFVGETSAGKSTILNLLIGDDILPTSITACTTRICRIRNSQTLSVSTFNNNNQKLNEWFFKEKNEMEEKLNDLARTVDPQILYVDVNLPVPTLHRSVVLVDTPGIGDISQRDVTKIMMDYCLNALAVVFVLNVANSGGIQSDRIMLIIEHLRSEESKKKMISFDPADALFMFNKWDTILKKTDAEEFFKSAKAKLHTMWEEINDENILKLSAGRANDAEEFGILFNGFRENLGEVIKKNENKRMHAHQRWLQPVLDTCQKKISRKLQMVVREGEQISTKINCMKKKRSDLRKSLEKINVQPLIGHFLELSANRCYEYLNSGDFRERVLENTDTRTRFGVRGEIIDRISKEIAKWQENHMESILRETIVSELRIILSGIDDKIFAERVMQGLNTSLYNTISYAVAVFFNLSSTGLLSSMILLILFPLLPIIAAGALVTGILGGMWLGIFTPNLKEYRIKEFELVMKGITKENIRKALQEVYAGRIEKHLQSLLEELQMEVNKIDEELKSLMQKHDSNSQKLINIRSLHADLSNLSKFLPSLNTTLNER